jgi:hypothetical protein
MRVIYRICHFILYAILYILALVTHAWQDLKDSTINKALHLVYGNDNDIAILTSAQLSQQLTQAQRQLSCVALIFNQVGRDVELEEIKNVCAIVGYLVHLRCSQVLIYDQHSRLWRHAKLIREMLKH